MLLNVAMKLYITRADTLAEKVCVCIFAIKRNIAFSFLLPADKQYTMNSGMNNFAFSFFGLQNTHFLCSIESSGEFYSHLENKSNC